MPRSLDRNLDPVGEGTCLLGCDSRYRHRHATPPSALALIASNPSSLDQLHDPAARIIEICERGKEWLLLALDGDDIEQIAEVKSQAEALRVYAIQKQFGKDAELSAQELVRRAERGIGVAIRLGQERGDIRGNGAHEYQGNQHGSGALPDKKSTCVPHSPADYFSGGSETYDTYAVTDDVTAEQFDEAIDEAKDEGNLSRANVVRKVKAKKEHMAKPDRLTQIREMADKGSTSRQIAKEIGLGPRGCERVRDLARENNIAIPADTVTKKSRQVDSNRVVAQIVLELDSLAGTVDLVASR